MKAETLWTYLFKEDVSLCQGIADLNFDKLIVMLPWKLMLYGVLITQVLRGKEEGKNVVHMNSGYWHVF